MTFFFLLVLIRIVAATKNKKKQTARCFTTQEKFALLLQKYTYIYPYFERFIKKAIKIENSIKTF